MAVVIDATGTKKYKSASTSFSNATVITIATGNALVVTTVFGYSGSAPTGLTCTWNSVPMTLLCQQDRALGGASVAVFGLRSPASGAQTLALSWTNNAEIFVDAISFTGVDTTSDAAAFPHQATQDAGVAQTVAVTSAVGNYVVACESPNVSGSTLTGTTLYFDASSGSFVNAGSNYDVGAATVNIGLASGGATVNIAVTDVGAAGAAVTVFTSTLLTMGVG